MANPEHLDTIMRGVNAWNEWRIQNPGICPDLSNIRLQGRVGLEPPDGNLSVINLSDTNLTGAALWNLNIHTSNLQNINAYGADLRSFVK